jgi:hypothetical protein
MLPTYGSFRNQFDSTLFTAYATSGDTTEVSAGDYNVYLQFENRAGRNLLSEPNSVSITAGQGIVISILPNAIASGEDVFSIVVSLEKTGDSLDAVRVASWQARESNQLVMRSLPITIDFTTDEHFKLTRTYPTIDLLPDTGIKNGAIALVTDSGKYYRYDAEAVVVNGLFYSYSALAAGNPLKNWVEYDGSFATYLATTRDAGGCDRRLSSISNALKIPPKSGNADSNPLRIWLNNGFESNGDSPIVAGKYSLEISVDGVPGYENLFADQIKYTLRGYCDRASGILNTNVLEVGFQKTWNPTSGLIVLPEQLPRGQAAVYDLVLSFSASRMLGKLPSKPVIGIDVIDVFSIQGRKSDFAEFLGDIVYSDLDKLVIVPGLKRLAGKASFKTGFIIDDPNELMITGVVADTSNQIAALSGALNGFVTVRQQGDTLAYAEVVRALFSTATGMGKLIAGSALPLANQGISVTVNHPYVDPVNAPLLGRVRPDYPDTSIAGNEKALFTGYKGYLYLKVDSTIYRSSLLGFATTPQVINVNNLSSFTIISSLPIQNDPYFSLFEPESVTRSAIAGSITGTVTAYFAYAYETGNTKITHINHNVTEAIATANLPLSEVIGNLTEIVDHLDNFNNPHQVTREQIEAASQTDLTIAQNNINTLNTQVADFKTKTKTVTGNYTIASADYHHVVTANSANPVTITLDHTILNTSVYNPFEVIVRKSNTGDVNIAIASGGTLQASGTTIPNLYDSVYFAYVGSGNWIAIGNLV